MIVRNPFSQPWSFVGLELVVLACAVLGFLHAWRAWKSRDALPLFTWIAIVSYGVAMEIVSYNTVDNFTHGPFTVMLYHGKLPLYVTLVYPVLLYTGIACVRRLGLSRWAEPLACGLAIVLLDVPFDILGPHAGWWTWSGTEENVMVKWLGVPYTSYYWHIAFGACLALLTRSADTWLAKGVSPFKLLVAPIAGLFTIVLGGISFIPFHLLKRVGVSEPANLAILAGLALAILVLARKAPASAPDRALFATPIAYHAFFLAVLVAMKPGGEESVVILLATTLSLGLHAYVRYRPGHPGLKAGAASLADRPLEART